MAELLRTARSSLGLSLAFLSRMDGTTQTLEVVESAVPQLMKDGVERPQSTSLCQAVLDGRLPKVMSDLRDHPLAMELPAARFPRLRSYLSVPVTFSDGTVYGTFCAAGLRADESLGKREQSLMEVLARAAAMVIEPQVRTMEREREIRGRLEPVMAAGGPAVLLQPIVRLADGARIGAEALSRFPAEWALGPDVCFEQAHSVGEGVALELQALVRGASYLDEVDGYIALNASPVTLLDAGCRAFLAQLPPERVLVELSEHDAVEDYEALADALAPLRASGVKLAIDDVGAGFSSLRHVVRHGARHDQARSRRGVGPCRAARARRAGGVDGHLRPRDRQQRRGGGDRDPGRRRAAARPRRRRRPGLVLRPARSRGRPVVRPCGAGGLRSGTPPARSSPTVRRQRRPALRSFARPCGPSQYFTSGSPLAVTAPA